MTLPRFLSGWIGKTLVVSTILFGAYSAYILLARPDVSVFQNQWIRNYVRAEDYLYAKEDYPAVVVGTSLAAKLPAEKIEPQVYNLAFEGGSALTGLNIIAASGRYPKVVLIESNLVDASSDQVMLDSLFTPVEWRVKGHTPAMQDRYQPINLMLTSFFREKPRIRRAKLEKGPDPAVFEPNLKMQAQALNVKGPGFSAAGLDELKKAMDLLRAKNVRILFFRMPVDPSLVGSVKYVATQRELKKRFPDIGWLPQPDDSRYETEDGSHLTYRASLWFADEFNRWVGDLFDRAAERKNPEKGGRGEAEAT